MKIIAYDDNPDFGGHQILACQGIEALAADPSIEIVFMINPANERLAARLHDAHIRTCAAAASLPVSDPDLFLCIQGNTVQSFKGMKAARNGGIECVSYLALPHTMSEMGTRLGKWRDRINRQYIDLPDRFITISERMKGKLQSRGCTKPIDVVPNGVNIPVSSRSHRNITPPSPCILGLAGRIEFTQKQQDFVVDALRQHPDWFEDCQLLIAGYGPDEQALRKMISGVDTVSFLPWQQDMDSFYDRIDLLVIPSRYEGVPLVMLEALGRGIPVIGTSVDGMKEVLPEEWVFACGDIEAFARTLMDVRTTWRNSITPLQQRILNDHSLESFKTNFVKALCGH